MRTKCGKLEANIQQKKPFKNVILLIWEVVVLIAIQENTKRSKRGKKPRKTKTIIKFWIIFRRIFSTDDILYIYIYNVGETKSTSKINETVRKLSKDKNMDTFINTLTAFLDANPKYKFEVLQEIQD